MDIFQDSIIFIEILSFFLALFSVKKIRSNYFYFFIGYLFFAILFETIGNINFGANTYWIYNIYTFFEFLCVAGIYYSLMETPKSKKIILILSGIFYSIYFLSFIYVKLQNYTVILIPFFVVPFMFMYLKNLLNSKKIINFKKVFPFWITVAFLIYYIASVPFFSLQYLYGLRDRLLFTLLSLIVILMHLIFSAGLLWSKPTQK